MCRINRDDLRPNAYIRDTTGDEGLYRVERVKQGRGYVQVVLEDVRSPLTSERLPDPDVPGKLGASMVLNATSGATGCPPPRNWL